MSEIIKKYDFIISLGRMCHVSDMLSHNNLKVVNGPWDWLATSDTDTIYHNIECLYKGFKNFLNRNDLKSWEPYKYKFFERWNNNAVKAKPIEYVNNHTRNYHISDSMGKAYYNIRTKTFYLHDFYENPSFDEQYKQVYKKYERRNQRTLNYIQQSDKILLIYMSHLADQILDLPLNVNKIIKRMNKLRKKYPNKTIDLYMFDHNPNFHDIDYQRIVHDVGIIQYLSNHDEVYPSSDTDVRHIADSLMMPKAICHILSQIALTDRHKMI